MIWPGPSNVFWQPVLEPAERLAALDTISIAAVMAAAITSPIIGAAVTAFADAVAAATTAFVMRVATDGAGASNTVAADQWSAGHS